MDDDSYWENHASIESVRYWYNEYRIVAEDRTRSDPSYFQKQAEFFGNILKKRESGKG